MVVGADGAEMDVSSAYFEYYLQRYFYIQNVGNNQITIKTLDGKYLGISDPIKDGTRVRAVDSPYAWNSYTTTKIESAKADPTGAYINLRPPENTDIIVNVSEGKFTTEGQDIILWTSKGKVPNNAKLSWKKATEPSKTLTTHEMVHMLYYQVMDRLYADFNLAPAGNYFPPASDSPFAKYFWDGSGPEPYEGLEDKYGSTKYGYAEVARLRFWGVIPPGAHNPNAELTYGEFVQYLQKLMAYDKQNLAKWGTKQGFYMPRATFTSDIINR